MSPLPSITAWDARPVDEFAGFVVTPAFVETSSRQRDAVSSPISAESAAIYKFMFGKFAAWMLERGLKMSTVNASDLQASSSCRPRRPARPEQQDRLPLPAPAGALLRLPGALAESGAPGHRRLDRAQMTGCADDRPRPDELERFLAALPAVREADDAPRRRLETPARPRDAGGDGAGRPARGRGDRPAGGRDRTPAGRRRRHRTEHHAGSTSTAPATSTATTLPRLGVAELFGWLKERAALEIPGSLAFPANMDGEALHKATVYRQVRATFERAGMAVRAPAGARCAIPSRSSSCARHAAERIDHRARPGARAFRRSLPARAYANGTAGNALEPHRTIPSTLPRTPEMPCAWG
jgi:integrase/recombinase XerD